MYLNDSTEDAQRKLATFCRTGEVPSIDGIKQKHIHHYRRLVFNVVNSTMEQAFPITRKLMGDKEWSMFIDDFFSNHNCTTAQVWKLPFELYNYVSENDISTKMNKPFLKDLLYFEWIEIEVHTMEDIPLKKFKTSGNIYEEELIINPEHRIMLLEYPIHLFKAEEAIKRKGDHILVVYRHPDTKSVHFMNLSILFTYTLELLNQRSYSLKEIIPEVSQTFGILDLSSLKEQMKKFISEVFKQRLILGFKVTNENNEI